MTTASPTPAQATAVRAVPPHTSTQVLGLSLLGGAVLMLIVAAVISGVPIGEASFLAVFVAAALLGAALAHRTPTWGRAVGLVLGLGAAAMTFWMAFGLFQPASFIEFTTGTAWVVGVVLSLYGGIGALVRRKEPTTEVAHTEVQLDRIGVGLVVLALLVSLPMWMVARTTVDEAAAAGLPEVTAANFAYEDITAASGGELVVRNSDPFIHTFTIDALNIDVELLPGASTIIALPSTAGTFTFYCIPHSSEAGEAEHDMAASLTLE